MAVNTSGFGAYDIRGIYPESINQELAYRVGRIFPELFDAKKLPSVMTFAFRARRFLMH